MRLAAVERRTRYFKGNWNPERRKHRMTKEHGTLPSLSNSAVLAPGGAIHAVFAGAALLVAVLSFTKVIGRI